MKNLIFLLSVFTFCAYTSLAQTSQTKTDKEQAGLKGQVKSVEVFRTFFYMNGSLKPAYKITYNPQGNITERILYNRPLAKLR